MARAHAASACVQSDSFKGLAQSIAKPAYHRLLIAEPALRRVVPTLIVTGGVDRRILAWVPVDSNLSAADPIHEELSTAQLLAAPNLQGDAGDMTLPNGNGALAIARLIKALPGQVIVIQEKADPLWG